MEERDALLLNCLENTRGYDLVALALGSMLMLQGLIQDKHGVEVMPSPLSAVVGRAAQM